MAMLDCAPQRASSALMRWLLGPGIATTLAANVAHCPGHGLMGAAVAARPTIAPVGPYEPLMVRSVQHPGPSQLSATSLNAWQPDSLQQQAAQAFTGKPAVGRVPSCARSAPGHMWTCSSIADCQTRVPLLLNGIVRQAQRNIRRSGTDPGN
jgi:hypothetical protein